MPNTLQSAFITSPYDKEEECSNFLVENIDDSFLLTDPHVCRYRVHLYLLG